MTGFLLAMVGVERVDMVGFMESCGADDIKDLSLASPVEDIKGGFGARVVADLMEMYLYKKM